MRGVSLLVIACILFAGCAPKKKPVPVIDVAADAPAPSDEDAAKAAAAKQADELLAKMHASIPSDAAATTATPTAAAPPSDPHDVVKQLASAFVAHSAPSVFALRLKGERRTLAGDEAKAFMAYSEMSKTMGTVEAKADVGSDKALIVTRGGGGDNVVLAAVRLAREDGVWRVARVRVIQDAVVGSVDEHATWALANDPIFRADGDANGDWTYAARPCEVTSCGEPMITATWR